MLSRLNSFLYHPISIASLVFFRIAFAVMAIVDVLSSWIHHHFWVDSYNPDRMRFPYYGFEWLPTFHDPWMSIIFVVILLSAIGLLIGYRYRLSATVLAFGFLYLFLLEKAYYLNHGYFFCWIAFVMIFLPAHRAFSLDVWRKPALHRSMIPRWGLLPLPLLMSFVYFFGGIAKLNPEWLAAIPLKIWLRNKDDTFLIGDIVVQDWVPYFMSWGGAAFDLTISFLMLNRYTRSFAFATAVFFHLTNHLIFNIGIFPYLSVALTALFFSPDFPLRFVRWLSPKWSWVGRWQERWQERVSTSRLHAIPLWQEQQTYRSTILLAFVLMTLIHAGLPLRHHFYPGDVAWTEEGHKYSWRMMLRAKSGRGHFTVVHEDGSKEKIELKDHLYPRQVRKVLTRPSMMLQFAHHLRDKYAAQGETVEVYADVRVKLNGRLRQHIIDPAYDLAKAEWQHFKSSEWILPYKDE